MIASVGRRDRVVPGDSGLCGGLATTTRCHVGGFWLVDVQKHVHRCT